MRRLAGHRKAEKKVWQHRKLGVAHEIQLGLLLVESGCSEVSHDEAASSVGDCRSCRRPIILSGQSHVHFE